MVAAYTKAHKINFLPKLRKSTVEKEEEEKIEVAWIDS